MQLIVASNWTQLLLRASHGLTYTMHIYIRKPRNDLGPSWLLHEQVVDTRLTHDRLRSMQVAFWNSRAIDSVHRGTHVGHFVLGRGSDVALNSS